MKKQIHSEILIHCSPKKVWDLLMDFENYPKWNPFIRSIEGNLKLGEKLKVKISADEKSSMKFNPIVMSLRENEEFSWLGKLGFKGIFDGLHKFEIVDLGAGKVLFKHSENFSGILIPFFDLNSTQKGFEKMNKKMKQILENEDLLEKI